MMTDNTNNGPLRRDGAPVGAVRTTAGRPRGAQAPGAPAGAAGAAGGAPATSNMRAKGAASVGVSGASGPHAPKDGKGGSKRMTVIIVIVCLAVVAAVVAGIVVSMGNSGFFDDSARSGQAPYKSEEEIQAELNRQVEEGMLNISIASTIEFEDGTSSGKAYIENVPSNHYVMKVSMVDNNTGETLYESGGIRPGEYIEDIMLAKDLDAGVYDATATFTAYDQTTLEEVGEAAAIVTLNVKN